MIGTSQGGAEAHYLRNKTNYFKPMTLTKTNYRQLASFNLKTDYVNLLTESEKVECFRDLGDDTQEPADQIWLETHDSYPYTSEFMAWWVTNHYAAAMQELFVNPEIDCGSAEVVFEMKDGTTVEAVTPVKWCEMPREFLVQQLMLEKGIDVDQIESHCLID